MLSRYISSHSPRLPLSSPPGSPWARDRGLAGNGELQQWGTGSTGALLVEACFGTGRPLAVWNEVSFGCKLNFISLGSCFLLIAHNNIGNVEPTKRSSRLISMSTNDDLLPVCGFWSYWAMWKLVFLCILHMTLFYNRWNMKIEWCAVLPLWAISDAYIY